MPLDPTPDASSPAPATLTTVVFDLGKVVLEWEPHRAFAQVIDPEQVPSLMERIDFDAWNRRHDAGLRYADGERELAQAFPDDAEAIRAYRAHFAETLIGMVPGTAAVIAELQRAGVHLLALTNWSDETFPRARERFGILRRFADITVSGAVGLAKPDPAIFTHAAERIGVAPAACVFIDDSPPNVDAAAGVGFTALHFTDAATLRAQLVELGLLGPREVITQTLFHVTERSVWEDAVAADTYPWSTRGATMWDVGYVHTSFAAQLEGTVAHVYADVDPEDLVVLEVDPAALGQVPVVVEDLGAGQAFPHLYGTLPLAAVHQVHDWPAG